MRFMASAVFIASLSIGALPAAAGEGKFARGDGTQLHIKCQSSGCVVRGKNPGGTWGHVEKGPGGSKNYKKLVAKYQKMGFAAN